MMDDISGMYDSNLSNIDYSGSYNIRMHGVQTSLVALSYSNNVDKNSINFGYYCPNTTKMLKKFKGTSSNSKVILDEATYDSIFNTLKTNLNLIIYQTGEREVSLYDMDRFLDEGSDDRGEYNKDNEGNDIMPIDSNTSGNSDFNMFSDFDNDLSKLKLGEYWGNNGNGDSFSGGDGTLDDYLDNIAGNGENSFFVDGVFVPGNGDNYLDMVYNEIIGNGDSFRPVESNWESGNGDSFNPDDSPYQGVDDGKGNYDYIYGLLANSLYDDDITDGPLWSSSSSTEYGASNKGFKDSENSPFFKGQNGNITKETYDITIVYGAKSESSVKIVGVTPIGVTQEINASGQPLYNVYEFIAKDVNYNE